jgi:hypothetical protein
VHHRNIFIFAALALAGTGCAAQTVYRCGNSYGNEPCPGGAAVASSPLAPTAVEAARAAKVAQSDARRADALEKARLAQEKSAPKAIVMAPAQPAVPAASDKRAKASPGKPEQFTATVPGTGKPKKKK